MNGRCLTVVDRTFGGYDATSSLIVHRSSFRVLDLSMGWAGPLVSFMLAELGAEVIKVEARERFDWWRGPHPRDAARRPDGSENPASFEYSAVFNTVNRHKQGITLDLTTTDGRAALLDLVRVSDVLVENFTPHAMTSLRLGYDVLSEVNPQIVMISMPAFGSTGPECEYIGYGMTIEAMAGMTAITGYRAGPPQMLSNAYGDPVSGLNGAVAALVALRGREQHGRGCLIEVAQVEGFIPLVAGTLLDAQMNGRNGTRSGNRQPSMAPHGVFPCWVAPSPTRGGEPSAASVTLGSPPRVEEGAARSEGDGRFDWVAIAVGADAEWAALCRVMGRPELVDDARFADVVNRKRHEDEIDAVVTSWTCRISREAVVARLVQAGVAVAPVQNSAGLLADPVLALRGFFSVVDRAYAGTHPYPGLPFHRLPLPESDPRPAPCLGEDSEAVLTGLLGMGAARYEALSEAGVTGRGVVALEKDAR